MKRKHYPGSGTTYIIDRINRTSGYSYLKKFLDKLSDKLIKKSADFLINVDCEFPIYGYSEKSFHTILTPSIYEITKNFVVENPIGRQKRGNKYSPAIKSHGWTDYWIEYDNKIRIYLELKHGYLSARSGIPSQNVLFNLWKGLDAQLDTTEGEAKRDRDNWATNQTIFRAGMLILPFYQRVSAVTKEEAQQKLANTFKKFTEHLDLLMDNKLNPQPKWGCLFYMDKKFHDDLCIEYPKGKFISRPGFIILLNFKILKKE